MSGNLDPKIQGSDKVSSLQLVQRGFFRLRAIIRCLYGMAIRNSYWRMQGMRIGSGTVLPAIKANWPHQVSIGGNCLLEDGVFFKYDGVWSEGPRIVLENHCFVGAGCEFNIRRAIRIGASCLIASGCKFIDHDHGTDGSGLIRDLTGKEGEIVIGDNVWMGVNAVVLKDVTIGAGAVIAAGAVVTRSVPANEIWGGVPAVKIRVRRLHSPVE